jgi:UDP-N-acetyl-D-mannosaminuronic acid dehydrogenase
MTQQKKIKSISVIGLGYIGLPTAALFAHNQIKVIGVDVNQMTVDTINQGKIHIVEPDLADYVERAIANGFLQATTLPKTTDAYLIAVPTPFGAVSNGIPSPDLSYVQAAVESIAQLIKTGDLIILESTSPVGTTEKVAGWLAEARHDLTFPQSHGEKSDIRIAYCPERVLPGLALRELVENDRVIGGMTSKCANEAHQLYKTFVQGECIMTDTRSAEMCKLTENSFRDVNIAFANELSIICDKFGINTWELIKLANRHPRVNILQPGPGVGGHCIAVDPWFIASAAPKESIVIRAARSVNDQKPNWIIAKIQEKIASISNNNGKLDNKNISIAFFGLTFKPNIDDLRESPALEIVRKISKLHNGPIYIIEPNIKNLPKDLEQCTLIEENRREALEASIVVFLVKHKQFKKIIGNYSEKTIKVDACGIKE